MIARIAASLIAERLRSYPAVALVGPRQAGKTTLARSIEGHYFDLEQEADRVRLDVRWPELTAGKELLILDEVQAYPPVMARLRSAIDADRARRGRFLLLGSIAPAMMHDVAESLAGRLSLVDLSPLLLLELTGNALADVWLRGGFPDGGALDPDRYPGWQLDYLTLLTHRDLPAWGLPSRPQVTDRLVRMLAAWHGQLWNASEMGRSLGLSHPTVNSYLDFLEGAFLIRRLPPFSGNVRKRLVKSPRIFWRDSGLLHATLGVESYDQLLSRPWVGASWEGFVIEQLIGTLRQLGRRFDATFFRTSDGIEIDLVLDLGSVRWAIEAKLTSNPSPGDLRRLSRAGELVSATRRILVSQTPDSVFGESEISCNLPALLKELPSLSTQAVPPPRSSRTSKRRG